MTELDILKRPEYIGLLVPIRWPKAGLPLAAVTLAVAVICVGIAIYIAQPGYRIRHPEFRSSETLAPYSETHPHDTIDSRNGLSS